jgi:hypothetical protein
MSSAARQTISVIYRLADTFAVWAGILRYCLGGIISMSCRRATFRRDCATEGTFTESMAPLLRRLRPARPLLGAAGFLGSFSEHNLESIMAARRKEGFYVFEKRLPDTLIDELNALATDWPAFVLVSEKARTNAEVSISAPRSGKNTPSSRTMTVRSPAMQKLMADYSFPTVAESYLGAIR